MKYLLGIDAGTTGLKSILYTIEGRQVVSSYREYSLFHPRADWAEQDTEQWDSALATTIQDLLGNEGVSPGDIAGLSISAQASTCVPLDSEGKALMPAINWLDRRAVVECEIALEKIGEDVLAGITGLSMRTGWTAPMISWIKRNRPEVYSLTKTFALVSSHIAHYFSGQLVCDYSDATRTLLLDPRSGQWSDILLEAFEIDREKLPRLAFAGTPVGIVNSRAAERTGLSEGTPVCVGAFDQACCVVGSGIKDKNAAMVSLGTATMVSTLADDFLIDSQSDLFTSCHVLPDCWSLQQYISTTGVILRWFRDNFMHENESDKEVYALMNQMAESVPPGCDGLIFLPFFAGQNSRDNGARCNAAFCGMTLAQTRSHFVRAIMEGVAFEINNIIHKFNRMGIFNKDIHLIGGGAKSRLWRQIIADVTGLRVLVPQVLEAGTLGAAILAGTGVGVYASVEEGIDRAVKISTIVEPDSQRHSLYAGCFEEYMKTKHALYGSKDMHEEDIMLLSKQDDRVLVNN